MKITLSKSQWAFIGNKAGWMKKAQTDVMDEPVKNVVDIEDTEWNKELEQGEAELDKEQEEKRRLNYEANKDTEYYVTIYKSVESGDLEDKYEILQSIPVKGLELAEEKYYANMDLYLNDADILVDLETKEENGHKAI